MANLMTVESIQYKTNKWKRTDIDLPKFLGVTPLDVDRSSLIFGEGHNFE